MLPEVSANWPVLSQLLDEVLALPSADREGWLRALPVEHWPLRETLRRLLEVQAGIETRPFLETLPRLTATSTPASGLVAGDEVGRYRLLEELGTGGMGCVWLAERADGQLKRKIALKLPRMVWADDLATRMARERDILGALEHPNIARLYDAGVDDKGRPYLALEYVEGQRIDAYCDARCLTIRQRIELFLQVLAAVQYAHVNLVVHRDIKPANVLINQQGAAKLLDFGIARLEVDARMLKELGDVAQTSTRAMTPRYASPEQVRGERLSLVSDVYSLGVLLYELLTGRSPYHLRNDSRAALEIAVTEGDIRPPSRAELTPQAAQVRLATVVKLSSALRGDLDAIVMKSLSLDAGTRYLTVQAFGDDLTRWLRGEVILAKRAPAYEVVRKFVLRNRWPVAIASVSFVAVVATAIIAVWQAREARQESRRATATRDFLIALFDDANPELRGGKDVTARELLLEGEKRLPAALASEPELQAEVLLSIANVWARFGDVERALSATQSRRNQLLTLNSEPEVVQSLIDEASLHMSRSNYERAQELINEAKSRSNGLSLPEKTLSDLQWSLGWLEMMRGDVVAAENSFSKAKKFAASRQDETRISRALYGQLQVAVFRKNSSSASRLFDEYENFLSRASLPRPEKMRRQFELVTALYAMGGYRKGWKLMQEVLRESSQIYGEFSVSQETIQLYWINWAIRLNEIDAAKKWILQRESSLGARVGDSKRQLDWIIAKARVHVLSGDFDFARRILDTEVFLERTNSSLEKLSVILAGAELQMLSGNHKSAIRFLDDSLAANSELSQIPQVKYYNEFYRGVSHLHLGDHQSAGVALRAASGLAEEIFGRDHPRFATVGLHLTLFEMLSVDDRSDFVKVEKIARQTKSVLDEAYPSDHPYPEYATQIVKCAESTSNRQNSCLNALLIRDFPFNL